MPPRMNARNTCSGTDAMGKKNQPAAPQAKPANTTEARYNTIHRGVSAGFGGAVLPYPSNK